jgi:hypothetical protein
VNTRFGGTGYIDYIKRRELKHGNGVGQGVDQYKRPFFSLKVRVYSDDGSTWDTFSTFFQRYTDCQTLWQCCGHDGPKVFETAGGMDQKQFSILTHLLLYGQRFITSEEKERIRFCFFENDTNVKKLKVLRTRL